MNTATSYVQCTCPKNSRPRALCSFHKQSLQYSGEIWSILKHSLDYFPIRPYLEIIANFMYCISQYKHVLEARYELKLNLHGGA